MTGPSISGRSAMPVPTLMTTIGNERRSTVLSNVVAGRVRLLRTDDSALRNAGPDDLALAGVCYVLPQYAQDCDRQGAPRMWPWDATSPVMGQRRVDLVLAAVYFTLAADRVGPTYSFSRSRRPGSPGSE